jgi:O-antigen/teichoic acid export membrane protein
MLPSITLPARHFRLPGASHFVQSVAALGLAQVLSWGATAALVVVLPSYLGDVNLGRLTFATTLTGTIAAFSGLGISAYLSREIARRPDEAEALMGNALAMRIPLCLLGIVLTVILAQLTTGDPLTRQLIYVLCLGMLLGPLGTVILGAIQGFQLIKAVAGFTVLGTCVNTALVLAVVHSGRGLLALAVVDLVVTSLGLVVGWNLLRGRTRLSLRFDRARWKGVFLGSLPFLLWMATTAVYSKMDVVLLSMLSGEAVVGWYSAAYRIMGIPVSVPTIVITVVFPALAAASGSPAVYNGIARQALRLIVLACLPMGLGIMLLADRLIEVLRYPESFGNSVILVALLAPHIVLVGADMIVGTVLNTRERQWQWAMTGVAAAVLNPLANLIAIPVTQNLYGNGAIGAAVVTVLTEAFMLAVGLRLVPRHVFDAATLDGVLRCLVAGAVMTGAVWLSRDLPLVIPVAIGAVTYCAACVILGAISVDDLRQLHHMRRQSTAGVTG